jgi:hypothetical protein
VLLRRRAALALLVLSIASCRESSQTGDFHSNEPTVKAPAAALPAAPVAKWFRGFGPLVAYANDDTMAVVLLPTFQDARLDDTTFDAASANGVKVDLFGFSGLVDTAAVLSGFGKASYEEGCFQFSRGRVGGGFHGKWSVALPSGTARGLALERLSSLRGMDSTAFVDQIVALAAKIRGTRDTVWRGTPFMIDNATRVTLPDARVVAASVTQILPGDQHWAQNFFFVAEGPPPGSNVTTVERWLLAYAHPGRSRTDSVTSGLDREDEVGVAAAVISAADSLPVLMLETRGNEANGYAALGRVAPGRWQVVWSGPHEGGC